jgi:predicted PurR-regulated permease PerM
MDRNVWIMIGALIFISLAYLLHPFLDLIVYGIFIYYIARPLHERLLPKLKSNSISAALALVILALPVVLVLLYSIGVASVEMSNFISKSEIASMDSFKILVNETSRVAGEIKPDELIQLLTEQKDWKGKALEVIPGAVGSIILDVLSGAFGVLFAVFVIFIISFYLLIDGGNMREWLKKTFFTETETTDLFISKVDEDLYKVFSGSILTAGVIAIMGALVFSTINALSTTINIPYPVLMGVLCGITSLIPIAGVAIIWIPLAIYLIMDAGLNGILAQSLPSIILFALTTFLLVDWLPNMILKPRLGGHRIHKGLLLLSYIFGPIVFGLKGLFLGPMILVLTINYAEIIMPGLANRKK